MAVCYLFVCCGDECMSAARSMVALTSGRFLDTFFNVFVKHKTFISGLDLTMYLVTVVGEFLHMLANRIGCSLGLYLALDLR